MSDRMALLRPSNPFSTRFVQPGKLDFLFPSRSAEETFWANLRRHDYRGAIVGPHGHGKTTLLHHVMERIDRTHVRWISLNSQSSLPHRPDCAQQGLLYVVDGFEQLSWWKQRRWIRNTRLRQQGLLVTAHRRVGLPTLLQLTSDKSMAWHLVQQLLQSHDAVELRFTRDLVEQRLAQHGGNVRDLLFHLYDVWESRNHHRGAEGTGLRPIER